MRLTDLIAKTRKIAIEFCDETAEVEYRVNVVTAAFLREIRQMDEIESVQRQVAQAVVRWDVQDDEGKEIPCTVEAIEANAIPLQFLSFVLSAIGDDMRIWRQEEKKASQRT